MRLDERLAAPDPIVSFEFLPPRTVEAELAFWSAIEELAALDPAFVSVTCGAGGTTRDLTLAVVRRLARERGLEAVPHVTATGFTREGLVDLLAEARAGGADNVLALRGDPPRGRVDLDRPRGRRQELARADDARRRGRLLRPRRRLSRAAPGLARRRGRPRPPAREARGGGQGSRHPAVLRQRRLPPLPRPPARGRDRRPGPAGDHPGHERGPDLAYRLPVRRAASRKRSSASSNCARTTPARWPSSASPTPRRKRRSCWPTAPPGCTSTRSTAPRPPAPSSRRCAPTARSRPPSRPNQPKGVPVASAFS